MTARTYFSIRPATQRDQSNLAHLMHFDSYTHRHLDYRPPLEWIGNPPFNILEENDRMVCALACPPDPPQVAWLRLFAATVDVSLQDVWETMWEAAHRELTSNSRMAKWAAAIPLHSWLEKLLINSNFLKTHMVISLHWERQVLPDEENDPSWIIRSMCVDDLPAVQRIDQAAFVPVWQNSLSSLQHAYRQAVVASVVEMEGSLLAYQISTPTQLGGHIARLAVIPSMQGKGIGNALLRDTLLQFNRRGSSVITVNTQQDNHASLALYKRAGFIPSNEEYPIYQLELNGN